MSQHLPFGANTLVIPFTRASDAPSKWRGGMSRMRPAGELFRNGVVSTSGEQSRDAEPISPASADDLQHQTPSEPSET